MLPWARSIEAYTPPGEIIRLTVADLIQDATPEVVFADGRARRVLIYTREPGGGYTLAHTIPMSAEPLWLDAGDVNADGRQDLVAGTWHDGLWCLLNEGGGAFAARPIENTLGDTRVWVRDWNGDGTLDVLATGTTGIRLYAGHGDGTFAASRMLLNMRGRTRLAFADFNADGATDIAAVKMYGWNQAPPSNEIAVVLLDRSAAPLGEPKVHRLSPAAWKMVPIDLDGDAAMDLAVLEHSTRNRRGNVLSLRNRGTGRFDAVGKARIPYGTSMVVADFDANGRDDVLVGAFVYSVSNGKLVGGDSPFAPLSGQWATQADFDGDGVRDLIMWVSPHKAHVFFRWAGAASR